MAAIVVTRSSARSQIAYNSALRALRQASKWAACEIGPAPTTPILSNRASFSIIFFLLFSIFGGWSSTGHRRQEQRRCSDNACLISKVSVVNRHIAVGGQGSCSNDGDFRCNACTAKRARAVPEASDSQQPVCPQLQTGPSD